MEDLEQIQSAALSEVRRVRSMDALARVRAQFLGKKGELGVALRSVSQLPEDERKVFKPELPFAGLGMLFDKLIESLLRGRILLLLHLRGAGLSKGGRHLRMDGVVL